MRVVNRDAFLALPPGTIYCKGERWCFDSLHVKHDNSGTNDWYAADPAWIDANDSNEAIDRLEEMLANGASYPMQDSVTRDGMYEADAIFLIFEKADLLTLRSWIDAAIAVAR